MVGGTKSLSIMLSTHERERVEKSRKENNNNSELITHINSMILVSSDLTSNPDFPACVEKCVL